MLSFAAMVILAQAAPAPAAPQIDCAGGHGRVSVWDRARAPHLARYCDFVAHAEVRLPREPARADEAAAAAAALLPEQAEPLVLRARAALLQGKTAPAHQFFEQALALDAGALRDPRALLARAVVLREVGETTLAIEAYRRLLPKIDAIPGEEERTRALLDAAVALMLGGPKGVDAAQAVLKDAAQRGAPSLRAAARAVLALALDRAGARAQATAAAVEAHRGGALTALAGASPLGWAVEALAVQARLREVAEPSSAVAAWEAYLARAGQGPWAALARERLAELKKGSPGRKR